MRHGLWRTLSVMAVFGCLLPGGSILAGPLPFAVELFVPPVIADSQAPIVCTVTYLIADTANNDLFAARMRIAPVESDTPVNNRLPCPAVLPFRVATQALDVCASRGDPKSCLFADMGRGFERGSGIGNTSEAASRCSSDTFSDIAAACWMSGKFSVCNVACGHSPEEAVSRAQDRCQEKQQRSCPVTATVPVSGP